MKLCIQMTLMTRMVIMTAMTTRMTQAEEGGTKKKKNNLSKGTKPREMMGDGSLYHVILVCFLQELCPFLLQLGLNPTAVELGTAGFLHETVYNKLVNVYNNATHESLKSFKMDNDICITYGVEEDVPATFDKLSALAFSQAMNFIVNKHYHEEVQKHTLSGNHKPSLCIEQIIHTFCYTTTTLPNAATLFWEVWQVQES
jgi:hypothetical protein